MDLALVRACLNRGTYEQLNPRIPYDVIGMSTTALLRWIGAYFKAHPDSQTVGVEHLQEYIRLRTENTQDDAAVQTLLELTEQLRRVPAPDAPSMLRMLAERDLVGRVGALYTQYEHGAEVDFPADLAELLAEFQTALPQPVEDEYDIEEILDDMQDEKGVRLLFAPKLADYVGPIRGGDSIAFAAPPDAGKTSAMCRLAATSAKQCMDLWGVDRPILMLVNEGSPRTIYPRLYQAALTCTLSKLYEYRDGGILLDKYAEALGTPRDYVKVMSIAGKSIRDVEQIVERYTPSMIIVDMVSHVDIPAASKVEKIAALWEGFRTMALLHNLVFVGTIQIGESGRNTLFPPMESIDYSKTAVQAATDIIIMMGKINSMEHAALRGFSTVKNKRSVEGKPSLVEVEAVFDKDRVEFK